MKQTRTYRSLCALLVAGALLAAGCSKDEPSDFYTAHPDAVRFGVTIGHAPDTRANTEGDGTTFLPADRIAISADGGRTYSTYHLPATGDDWLPASGSRYIKWTEQSLSFKAYYPVTEGTSYATFTLPTDQSTLDGLRSADYMKATTTAQTAGQPVALAFEHQLAKLTVKITRGDEAKDLTISKVEIIKDPYSIDPQAYINSCNTGELTYTAIVEPRDAAVPDKKFIRVTVNSSAEFSLTGYPKLEKGKAYTLNLKVGHDGVQVAGITVEDWTPQDMDPGTAQNLTLWDGKYPTSEAQAKEWMGTESAGATDTDGSKHVFTITAARQLAALHYLVANGVDMANATSKTRYTNATYKLAADMDLNNHPWTPIGEAFNLRVFIGIFDGQGHTIRGMNITGNYEYNGFFANVEGVVKHLNVKGTMASTHTDGYISSGGIVGALYSTNSCIAFCSFEGTIASASGFTDNAGGIAGELGGLFGPGQILSCYTVVTAMDLTGSGGTYNKGGIAGRMEHNPSAIKGCYWQELTGITDAYGTKEGSGTVDAASFADAAGANAAVDAMNAATPTGYDYQWQAGTGGSYPVLVPKP